jgi:hypothetical protein
MQKQIADLQAARSNGCIIGWSLTLFSLYYII